MRILHLSLTGQPGPISDAELACGQITVLTGRNDSGKSFLLEGIDAALRDDANWHFSASLALFASVHANELWHRSVQIDDPDWVEDAHTRWPVGNHDDLRERLLATGRDDEHEVLLARMPVEGLPVSLWRCAAAWDQLTNDLREQLRRAVPKLADQAQHAAMRPLAIEPVGALDATILPEPIYLPARPDVLARRVTSATARLCRALRLLPSRTRHLEDQEQLGWEDLDEEPPLWAFEEHPEFQDSPRWMLDESGDSTGVHRHAVAAAGILSGLTQAVLPPFIADRYRLWVEPAPVVDMARGDGVRIVLEDQRTDVEFPIDRAASGYLVWLQLALSEIASRIDWYSRILDEGSERLSLLGGRFGEETELERDQARTLCAELVIVLDVLSRYASPEEADQLGLGLIEAVVQPTFLGFGAGGEPVSERLLPFPRQRLYLIDEPEQRLHPSLQRKAAAWLESLMAQLGAQCVLATHSLAFIDLPGKAIAVHEVVRNGAAAVVGVDLDGFTPHQQLAHDMGFDRGEMLARWRAFLFVEGEADEAILEGLYGELLAARRIFVSPVHGHRHHAGLLEMQLLLRGVATPVAALFDNMTEDQIQRMRRDEAYRREMLNRGDELATVASITQAEIRLGREVEILTIGARDIFDLLDEDAIRQTFGKRFPGHDLARGEFERHGGGNNRARKDFYWETYGVSMTVRAMRRVTENMRREGKSIEVLDDHLDRVERLAMQAELH